MSRAFFRSVIGALGVGIIGVQAALGQSAGSGFFVNPIWVMTNNHVVEDCEAVNVVGHGDVQDILRDPASDLALLRLAQPHAGAIIQFRATPPRLAEGAHVLGYPMADLLSASLRVTSGSVNARDGFGAGDGLIQISAPVQPVNSGGPVLDDAGRLIGVAVGVLRESFAQNVNFAIAPDVAQAFLRERGIAFTLAPDAGSARPLPDVVEDIATSIVPVFCSGAAAPDATESARPMVLMPERDVVGFDYAFLRGQSLEGCSGACVGDPQCHAFTFNRRHNACFLKSDARVLVTNADAISGVARPLAQSVLDAGFRIETDRDAPGGDFLRLRESGYTDCLLACATEPRCAGFAYLRAQRDCWLKDRIGPVVPMPGVEFGLR